MQQAACMTSCQEGGGSARSWLCCCVFCSADPDRGRLSSAIAVGIGKECAFETHTWVKEVWGWAGGWAAAARGAEDGEGDCALTAHTQAAHSSEHISCMRIHYCPCAVLARHMRYNQHGIYLTELGCSRTPPTWVAGLAEEV
jgi:hypothetical protein